MSVLKIHKDDSHYLHTPTLDVEFPLADDVKQLIKDMKETMLSKGTAVGLAAPQVGVSQAIIVWRGEGSKEPQVMINPHIIRSADFNHGQYEMCLSYPNEIYEVVRAKRITVRFFDENGEHYVLKYRGFEASIIQHEVDHLMGLTLKDRGTKLDQEIANQLLGIITQQTEGTYGTEDNKEN